MDFILPFLLSVLPVAGDLPVSDGDSVASHYQLPPIEVTSPLKQRGELFDQPVAGTSFNMMRIESERINTQKDFSLASPNLYLPDYGSKMTGSIYVRGIGARMEQPSMGLYLDNVPILNKNNYEFDFYDIRRADILRGPQGTLYGRNSIGGVMNIFTLSPLEYQGVKGHLGYGNGNTADAGFSIYRRESDEFGWSVALSHHSSDGFYTNRYDGSKADKILSEGIRTRLQWKPSDRLFIDNTLSFNWVDQKGFAYVWYDTATGVTGEINHNDPCKYNRTGLINGTTIRYDARGFRFQSVTSYQFMDDRMTLDQDFLPVSMFTLVQAQKEHAVTHEIIFRSNDDDRRWQWLTGAFGFYKHNRMNAPVTFKQDGIEQLIVKNANNNMGGYFDGQLHIQDEEFVIHSRFRLPSYGLALFHNSTYDVGRWKFSAGVRLDYEHVGLRYDNNTLIHFMYDSLHDTYQPLETTMEGRDNLTYLEVLPRVSAMYHFTHGNLYAIVSRGYKAGGINTQIFSDILQNRMRDDLIREAGFTPNPSEEKITYKPESNWNYEVGAHLDLLDRRLRMELAAFYIDCRNQQITIFPPGQGTGRMMSNAGKSRSYGAELSAAYAVRVWRFDAAYGFTDARFVEYDDNQNDYSGNKVPYAPRNTLYVAAERRFLLDGPGFLDAISLRADWRGAGKIYWNEDNSASQGFYGLLGAAVSFKTGRHYLDIWGRNLTGESYNTFYFKSIGNTFVQKGKPRQFGISVKFIL